MAELFGFTIQRATKDSGGERTFSTPTPDDGTIDVAGGGFFGQILDTDGRERTDLDLIRRYRDIAQQAEWRIAEIDDVGDVEVDMVFEPPWNPEMISEEGKKELGID